MSDKTCAYCGDGCYDGYGYAARGVICRECYGRWARIIGNVLGLDGPSWTEYGVELGWSDFEKLIERMDSDMAMRCRKIELTISDLQLCEMFPRSEAAIGAK